jgi:hypothetical protein
VAVAAVASRRQSAVRRAKELTILAMVGRVVSRIEAARG